MSQNAVAFVHRGCQRKCHGHSTSGSSRLTQYARLQVHGSGWQTELVLSNARTEGESRGDDHGARFGTPLENAEYLRHRARHELQHQRQPAARMPDVGVVDRGAGTLRAADRLEAKPAALDQRLKQRVGE